MNCRLYFCFALRQLALEYHRCASLWVCGYRRYALVFVDIFGNYRAEWRCSNCRQVTDTYTQNAKKYNCQQRKIKWLNFDWFDNTIDLEQWRLLLHCWVVDNELFDSFEYSVVRKLYVNLGSASIVSKNLLFARKMAVSVNFVSINYHRSQAHRTIFWKSPRDMGQWKMLTYWCLMIIVCWKFSSFLTCTLRQFFGKCVERQKIFSKNSFWRKSMSTQLVFHVIDQRNDWNGSAMLQCLGSQEHIFHTVQGPSSSEIYLKQGHKYVGASINELRISGIYFSDIFSVWNLELLQPILLQIESLHIRLPNDTQYELSLQIHAPKLKSITADIGYIFKNTFPLLERLESYPIAVPADTCEPFSWLVRKHCQNINQLRRTCNLRRFIY